MVEVPRGKGSGDTLLIDPDGKPYVGADAEALHEIVSPDAEHERSALQRWHAAFDFVLACPFDGAQ